MSNYPDDFSAERQHAAERDPMDDCPRSYERVCNAQEAWIKLLDYTTQLMIECNMEPSIRDLSCIMESFSELTAEDCKYDLQELVECGYTEESTRPERADEMIAFAVDHIKGNTKPALRPVITNPATPGFQGGAQ